MRIRGEEMPSGLEWEEAYCYISWFKELHFALGCPKHRRVGVGENCASIQYETNSYIDIGFLSSK